MRSCQIGQSRTRTLSFHTFPQSLFSRKYPSQLLLLLEIFEARSVSTFHFLPVESMWRWLGGRGESLRVTEQILRQPNASRTSATEWTTPDDVMMTQNDVIV